MKNSPSNDTKDDQNNAPQWDEEDFVAPLARLERMQSELTWVRLIPRQLIAPLSNPGPNPRSMHEQFGAAVSESSTMLDRLKRGWDDPQTAQLLERCKASEKRDANLTAGKDVPLWGWAKKTEQLTEAQHEERLAAFDLPPEEVVLEEFKDSSLEWTWTDDSKSTINVKVKGPGSNVGFQITRKRGPDGIVYEAECLGDTKEKHAISRCLSRRPLKMDLKFLLNMLLSYKTMKTAKCVQCQKLLDDHGFIPLARQPNFTSMRLESRYDSLTWDALHESCIKSQQAQDE